MISRKKDEGKLFFRETCGFNLENMWEEINKNKDEQREALL